MPSGPHRVRCVELELMILLLDAPHRATPTQRAAWRRITKRRLPDVATRTHDVARALLRVYPPFRARAGE